MNVLGMFAKYWEPGKVKTRLATDFGAVAAAEFHRGCVALLLRRFASLADRRVLAFAPPSREAAFQHLLDSLALAALGPENPRSGPPVIGEADGARGAPASVGGAGDSGAAAGHTLPRQPDEAWELLPQCAGGLGERIAEFFRQQFARGARRVALVGSDSPTVPRRYLEEAFAHLHEVPVVLGPSLDGGYYLVALNAPVPELFQGIAWSTGEVMEQTRGRLRELGLDSRELPVWYDVDTRGEFSRLRRELQGPLAAAQGDARDAGMGEREWGGLRTLIDRMHSQEAREPRRNPDGL